MAEKQMFCTSCEMYLGKDIKEHYVSEFHKYNCKRKLASLPPILLPEFEAKLKEIATRRNNFNLSYDCKLCKKTFENEHLYKAHIATKKHLKKEEIIKNKLLPKPDKISTLDNNASCLYCDVVSDTFENNLTHMFTSHGFELPYHQIVADKKQAIMFIATVIYKDHMCVQCECTPFKTTKAVLSHIKEKRHYHLNIDLYESDYSKYILDKALFKLSRTPFSQRILMEDPNMLPTIESSETTSHKFSENKDNEEWEDEEDAEVVEDEKVKEPKKSEGDLIASPDYQEPLMLMNGNLMLGDGRIIGNKAYLSLYKKNYKIEDNRPEIKIGKEYCTHRKKERLRKFKVSQRDVKKNTNSGQINFLKSVVRFVPKPQI